MVRLLWFKDPVFIWSLFTSVDGFSISLFTLDYSLYHRAVILITAQKRKVLFFELFSTKSSSWTVVFSRFGRTGEGKRHVYLFQWNTMIGLEDDSIAWQTANRGITHYSVTICVFLGVRCEKFVGSIWEMMPENSFSGRLIHVSMFDGTCTSKMDYWDI